MFIQHKFGENRVIDILISQFLSHHHRKRLTDILTEIHTIYACFFNIE